MTERWLGVIEGYYGKPLTQAQRLALIGWMPSESLDIYCYAPKDDAFHRSRWRERYDDEHMRRFEELIAAGKKAGVDFCFTISPGLDWRASDESADETALVDKLRSLTEVGCTSFGVLWDDVPPGGAELGEIHGRATAAAVEAVSASRWWTVGTDYAVAGPTPYLEALCKTVPDEVTVAWTGPQVVALDITAPEADRLADALDRKLLLWENFPVNDGPMSGVLHIGPYPARDPRLVDASAGVLFNLMPQAISNRIGVACGARFWRDPFSDREATWREVVASYPGLEPLARASRSWVGDPEPDAELVAWADAAPGDGSLRAYLESGCRDGLDPELASELQPWLDAWDVEANAMFMCLDILERGYRSGPRGMAGGVLRTNARRQDKQLFGIRNAVYPVMQQRGKETTMDQAGVVAGENLTDRLARRALKQG